jgi:hypothetical protein
MIMAKTAKELKLIEAIKTQKAMQREFDKASKNLDRASAKVEKLTPTE